MVLHSPMTRTPPEILTYIFRLYLPPWDEQMPASPPSTQRPSCLAQVCRLWRTIVESDHHLWTSIHFYFPSYARTRCKSDKQTIQAIFDQHFERSGKLPLSLTFTDHRIFSERRTGCIYLLVDLLGRHSRRWKRISLHLPGNYFSILFKFTQCDLSSLEHLHISNNEKDISYGSPRLHLGSATNLKSFANSGSHGRVMRATDLHWGRLAEVSFDFEPCNMSSAYQEFTHLGDCQNIIVCSLGIGHSFDYPYFQTITLPRLQTLRIRRMSDRAETHFLDSLILPQLETREIDSKFFVGSDRLTYLGRIVPFQTSWLNLDVPSATFQYRMSISPTANSSAVSCSHPSSRLCVSFPIRDHRILGM